MTIPLREPPAWCAWCGTRLPANLRRDARYDTASCRSAASRWRVDSRAFWAAVMTFRVRGTMRTATAVTRREKRQGGAA